MSNAISAMQGASYEGYVTVEEAGLCGMITLRGDLSDAKLKTAAKKLVGVEVPGTRGINLKGAKGAAWMSPDELLLMVPHADVEKGVAALTKALKGTHILVHNVSDARAVFRLKGAAVREVLAKLSPADVSPNALPVGEIRRTRLAQVAAAFWMADGETAEIVCFRSVAQYVFGVLKVSAQPGSQVH